MFDIIAFGSATRDLFVQSNDFELVKNKKFLVGQGICFNLGSKIYLDDLFFATGGGGTNAAVTFAKQGFKTGYMGKVGADPGGEAIIRELKQWKFKQFISQDKEHRTNYSIILSVPNKGRTILVYHGASHFINKKDISFNKLNAKWIYVAGLSGESSKILSQLVKFANQKKIKLALDPSSAQISQGFAKMKPVLSQVDVLKLNQEEAANLAGLPYKQEKKIFQKLDQAVKGIVVMTKGPKGVVVSDGQYLYRSGIFKEKKHVDRTGTGDAFGSGFVAEFIRSGDIEQAIRLGSANACSTVEHFGAKNGILTKQDFENKRWKTLKIIKVKI